jgi:AcrR family transcriptional regulator
VTTDAVAVGLDSASSQATSRLTKKGRATRERIVAAASGLMYERGVARTTIEDIQEAAHVSASQLYHYFTDKSALVMAVIGHQTDRVLECQHKSLDRLDGMAALQEWRDLMLAVLQRHDCAGGCPLGSLASDLSETDPVARAQLANSFAQWEGLLRTGLAAMRERGELREEADPDDLALAMLAAAQGGMLLSQVQRETKPFQAAVDTVIAHIRTFAA